MGWFLVISPFLKGSNKGEAQIFRSLHPKGPTPFSLCYFFRSDRYGEKTYMWEIGGYYWLFRNRAKQYEVGRSPHYLQGFIHSRRLFGNSEPTLPPPPSLYFVGTSYKKMSHQLRSNKQKPGKKKDKALELTWKWGSPRFQTVNPVELLKLYSGATRMSIKPP